MAESLARRADGHSCQPQCSARDGGVRSRGSNCVPNIVQFTTIQAAVNAVPPGSIIKICPANYPEQVVVNKNLTLTGVKSGTTDNPVLVIPLGGFVPNTTSLASGHPIAAQILVVRQLPIPAKDQARQS